MIFKECFPSDLAILQSALDLKWTMDLNVIPDEESLFAAFRSQQRIRRDLGIPTMPELELHLAVSKLKGELWRQTWTDESTYRP